jgi:hypothetical protein
VKADKPQAPLDNVADGPNSRPGPWGRRKWSMFNVQFSFFICGGASRALFMKRRAEGASENDK